MEGLLLEGKDHVGEAGTGSKVAAAGAPLRAGTRGHPAPLPISGVGGTMVPVGIAALAPHSEPQAGQWGDPLPPKSLWT